MAIYFDDIQGDVASIFLSYFKRAPEFEAMQHYVGVLQALQANPETAGNAFNLLAAHIYADGVASQEVPAGPTVTDSWYVSYLYSNVLGRAPDAEGLAYWVAELQAGNIARAELVGTFVAAALASEGRDAAYLNNRTEVAVEFAQWENSNPQVLPTLKYNAAEVLLGVNEDPATVAAAQSRLETTTGQVGETRNLTTNIDTIEGTTANDTFNAVFQGDTAGQSTLTPFDSIDGDLGTDTLNIYVGENANTTFPSTASVRNVEIVNIYNGGNAADGSLTNAANYQGVQQLWQIGSESNVTNVGADTAVGFRNITMEQMWADVTLANGVSAATIVLDNVGSAAYEFPDLEVYGNALSTVNVVGALNASAEHLDLAVWAGTGVRALTVNTAVDTHLFVAASGPTARINSLDLSGSTGDVLFTIGEDQAAEIVTEANGLTVTFGSGDDLIVFADRALTLRDVIDGGEGDDTLALVVDGTVQTQTYDSIARTVNFETIAFLSDTTAVIDAAQLSGFDEIALGGEGAFTLANLSSDVGLVLFSDDMFEIDSPSSVTLNNAAADVNVFIDEADVMLLVGTKGATGGTLTLVGDGAVWFGNQDGKFTTIDAEFLEGELEVAGMSKDVAETVVLGEDLAAKIVATMGDETVGEVVYANSSTLGRTDALVGFGDDDEIEILVTGVDGGEVRAATFAEQNTLQESLAAAAAQFANNDYGVDDVIVFAFGGDTYLFGDTVDFGGGAYDNGDFLLKIVGVTDTEMVAESVTIMGVVV